MGKNPINSKCFNFVPLTSFDIWFFFCVLGKRRDTLSYEIALFHSVYTLQGYLCYAVIIVLLITIENINCANNFDIDQEI